MDIAPGAVPAELAAVHEAARSDLVSALSEATSDTPSTPQAAPAESAPAPESPSPQVAAPDSREGIPPSAPAPIQVDPSTLSPEAKRFLDMKGGDINRALADALEYNNRLGKNGQPETAPAPTPPAQEPPAPVALDPTAIEQHVNQFLAQDQEAVSIVRAYTSLNAQLNAIDAQTKAITSDLAVHEAWLKLPEVQAEQFRKAEIEQKVRQLQADALLLDLKGENLLRRREGLEARFDNRADGYRAQLVDHLTRQQNETRQQALRESAIEDHAKTLERTWPTALEAIGKEKQLTPKQLKSFDKRAQDRALARLDHGLGPIEDVRGFLEAEATSYLEELMDHHREQSARYGAQVTQRAAQPGSTGAPSGVTDKGPSEFASLEDVKAAARKDAMARLSLR